MKVILVGSKHHEKDMMKRVLKNLDCSVEIEEIPLRHKSKYHIKHTPAIIIDNIVVSEDSRLSMSELKNIVIQFMET